jgi:hypothetical protein
MPPALGPFLAATRRFKTYAGRCGSLQNLIFERETLWVVFLKPRFRRVLVCKDLQMIAVTNLLSGVDVNPDRHVLVRRNKQCHLQQKDACSGTQD